MIMELQQLETNLRQKLASQNHLSPSAFQTLLTLCWMAKGTESLDHLIEFPAILESFGDLSDAPEVTNIPEEFGFLLGLDSKNQLLFDAIHNLESQSRKVIYFSAMGYSSEAIVESNSLEGASSYWQILEAIQKKLIDKTGSLPTDESIATLYSLQKHWLDKYMEASDEVEAFLESQQGKSYGKFLIISVATTLLAVYLFFWPMINRPDGKQLFQSYYSSDAFTQFIKDSVLPTVSDDIRLMSSDQEHNLRDWIEEQYEVEEDVTSELLWLECLLTVRAEDYGSTRLLLKDLKSFDPPYFSMYCQGLRWKIRFLK